MIVMEPLRGGNLALPTPPREIAAIWAEARRRPHPRRMGPALAVNHPEVTVCSRA